MVLLVPGGNQTRIVDRVEGWHGMLDEAQPEEDLIAETRAQVGLGQVHETADALNLAGPQPPTSSLSHRGKISYGLL